MKMSTKLQEPMINSNKDLANPYNPYSVGYTEQHYQKPLKPKEVFKPQLATSKLVMQGNVHDDRNYQRQTGGTTPTIDLYNRKSSMQGGTLQNNGLITLQTTNAVMSRDVTPVKMSNANQNSGKKGDKSFYSNMNDSFDDRDRTPEPTRFRQPQGSQFDRSNSKSNGRDRTPSYVKAGMIISNGDSGMKSNPRDRSPSGNYMYQEPKLMTNVSSKIIDQSFDNTNRINRHSSYIGSDMNITKNSSYIIQNEANELLYSQNQPHKSKNFAHDMFQGTQNSRLFTGGQNSANKSSNPNTRVFSNNDFSEMIEEQPTNYDYNRNYTENNYQKNTGYIYKGESPMKLQSNLLSTASTNKQGRK